MTDPLLRLEPDATVLVVIDPQDKLMPAIPGAERAVRATRLLLRAAAVLELPVIATTQYERGLGGLVKEVAELLPEATRRLDKTSFSCFDDERFAGIVADTGVGDRRPTLLICGVETHICVAGTVLGALRAGYPVAVATDAVAARGEADGVVALGRLERAGALLTTAEAAVYELLRDSSSAAFKAMLPFFKDGP